MYTFKKTTKTETSEEVTIQTPFYFQMQDWGVVSFCKLTEDNELAMVHERGDFFCVYVGDYLLNDKLSKMTNEIDEEQFNYYRSKTFSNLSAI